MKKAIIIGLIILLWLILLAGCESINQVEPNIDITGRYQDLNNSMILLLEHNYRKALS